MSSEKLYYKKYLKYKQKYTNLQSYQKGGTDPSSSGTPLYTDINEPVVGIPVVGTPVVGTPAVGNPSVGILEVAKKTGSSTGQFKIHDIDKLLDVKPTPFRTKDAILKAALEYNELYPDEPYEKLINELDKQLIHCLDVVIIPNLYIITNPLFYDMSEGNDVYIKNKKIIREHINAIKTSIMKLTNASIININIKAMVNIFILLLKLEININRRVMSDEEKINYIKLLIQTYSSSQGFTDDITDDDILLTYLELYITFHEYYNYLLQSHNKTLITDLEIIYTIIQTKINKNTYKKTIIDSFKDIILNNQVKLPKPKVLDVPRVLGVPSPNITYYRTFKYY